MIQGRTDAEKGALCDKRRTGKAQHKSQNLRLEEMTFEEVGVR